MTWFSVSDANAPMPAEQDIVEVQLANGTVRLACFTGHQWRIPDARAAAADPGAATITNVTKWRAFAESKKERIKSHWQR